MAVLERIWEFLGIFFGGLMRGFERSITSLFGSSNARFIKRLQVKVDAINALEAEIQDLSNEQLKERTENFRQRLKAGETEDDILVEAFAVCREAGRRFLNMRHFDVQLIGGIVLHSGAIAEMVTGEGKTLVATLPAYLNAISGKGVHVVTVNDYLARRDMEWMAPIYMGLGLTVGAIQNDMDVSDKQKAYACDITYGTNNEFGFDYLRDNMRPAASGDDRYPKERQQSQGRLTFAIIDEVDNILIDEARTPLIISGPAHQDVRKYAEADRISRQLKREIDFVVNEKDHSAHLTDEGVREAEKLAGVESFFTAGNMEWPHLIDNSLKAHNLYQRDVNYVVKDGSVVIVDEFTGRLMEGRQWSDGLHQAVEAKENVRIKEETQTLATITLQNFFKLYDKICGMTGTGMTEAGEFWKIYELDVIAIPTNRELIRQEHPDVIYRTENEKFAALAEEIERLNRWDVIVESNGNEHWGTLLKENDNSLIFQPQGSKQKNEIQLSRVKEIEKKGRPILVGTVSIEKSEQLSKLLDQSGVKHEVLNAKHHKREADIVAQAGRLGAVTIATNMAGRGTDIVLGGNPETMAWARLQDTYETRLDVPHDEWEGLVKEIEEKEQMKEQGARVKELGGLHVVATERHEARRIDLQLRGRTGRQGDPGSSRFFLSLEDDLMRIFAGQWVKSILDKLGMQEGEKIESKMVTRRIEAAQKKVEERNFEIRKNLLEYDEVMDEQRKRVYGYRQQILDGANCRDLIVEAIREQVEEFLGNFSRRDYGVETFADWAGSRLSTELEPRDFRGTDFEGAEAYAKDEAQRAAETQVFDTIEENLPDGEDSSDWNWEAIAKLSNTRWGTDFRDRDLRKAGRDGVAEILLERAKRAIGDIDLSAGSSLLDEDAGQRTAIAWVKTKFGFDIDFDRIKNLDPADFKALVFERAQQAYDEKESEYPVMVGLQRYTSAGASARIDRDGLVAWFQSRFDSELSLEDLKNKQRDEIRAVLIEHSRQNQKLAHEVTLAVQKKVESIFGVESDGKTAHQNRGGNGALEGLSQWLEENLSCEISTDEISGMGREDLERKLSMAVEDRYRPEMRRMERQLLLQIVDTAWKDHLLVMDHLRSSVGLSGYAQKDPKVEYKKEGMRLFDAMWQSIGERATDLIFRMEDLSGDFVSSTWVETSAQHANAQSASEIASEQEAAIQNSQDNKPETIRNRGERVGRNAPCPCGSGKKYKNCHMGQ
ncbi:MAG: SEC-C domain-containing protein [Pirellulaceae bacterium]|nr:SEC-C domain-containing protein [Pirellulaceae bacterium]